MDKDIIIRPYGGETEDLSALSNMIFDSWSVDLDKSPVFRRYDPDWLRWTLNAPGQEPDLILTAYIGDEPIGFLAALNRRMLYRGSLETDCILGAILTVHRDYRRRGVGWELIRHTIDHVKMGSASHSFYSVLMGFIQPKRSSHPLISKIIYSYLPGGASSNIIIKITHLVKVLRSDVISSSTNLGILTDRELLARSTLPVLEAAGEVGPMVPRDVPVLLERFNSISESVDLARIWDEESFLWQFNHLPVSRTIVLRQKGVPVAAVNYHRIQMYDGGVLFDVGEIDNMLLPDDPEEARAFFSRVLCDMRDRDGLSVAIVADLGYFDRAPLLEMDFIEYPRGVDLIGHSFSPGVDLDHVKGLYMDFR